MKIDITHAIVAAIYPNVRQLKVVNYQRKIVLMIQPSTISKNTPNLQYMSNFKGYCAWSIFSIRPKASKRSQCCARHP